MMALLGLTWFASAGDFHTTASLVCSDCHVMHYSATHTYSGAVTPDPLLASGGPYPKLLKNSSIQLCLACHDGKSDAPDVRGANTGTYVRAAGQLNVNGDGNEGTGHTIGSNSPPPRASCNKP